MEINNTILIYGAIGIAALLLYFYAAARNRKSNMLSDQLVKDSIERNNETAGKTRVYRPEQAGTAGEPDAQFGTRLGTISSKKIKRVIFAALLATCAYAVSKALFKEELPGGKPSTETGAEAYLPYFAMAVLGGAALYQLFLVTKTVNLHEKGVIYKSLLTQKRIAYNYLNIIESFDTERRKPVQGWLFEFHYFNYDIKIPVYYFNGDKGTSIKISQRQFSNIKTKVPYLREHLVWL